MWSATAAVWLVLLAPPVLAGSPHRHGAWAGSAAGHLVWWLLMVVAMMLPIAAPALRRSERTAARTRPTAVLAGYLAAWLGFGVLGVAGRIAVHTLSTGWAWPEPRPDLVAAAGLTVAGLYQFSPAKRRCLTACVNPCRPPEHGSGRGWGAGLRQAAASLGCCWALMLAMVALGSLVVMAALTVATGVEVSTARGDRLAGPLGVVLLWGAAVLALPALAGGAAG